MIVGSNFVFLFIPRCASNSLRTWFCSHSGPWQEEGLHHENQIPQKHRGKIVYAVVRNPYDRMLSSWYHTARNSQDWRWRSMCPLHFARSCQSLEYGANQNDFLTPALNSGFVIYAIPYEGLVETFAAVGFGALNIRANTEVRPYWKNDPALTPAFIRAVNKYAGATFKRFGYEKL